jgi:hypothetical protein
MRPAGSAIEPAVITLKLEWFVHQTSDQNYRNRVCMSKLRALNDPRDPFEWAFPLQRWRYRRPDCC